MITTRTQRRRMRRRYHMFFTLFIIGALLLIVPLVYSKAVEHHELTLAREYHHHDEPNASLRAGRRFNADLFNRQHNLPVKYHESITQVQKNLKRPLGFVRVPAIHLIATPIYYGDSDAVLAKGTGIMGGTSLPIGGKNTLSVVSGHSGLANRVIFDNIRYLKRGDIFYFTALGQPEIAYRVYKKIVVDPTSPHATDVVRTQAGKDRAVLLTCTPIFVNSHRLLVYGKRIPIAMAKATNTHARDAFTPLNIWFYSVSALMVLFILWFIITEWRYRRA